MIPREFFISAKYDYVAEKQGNVKKEPEEIHVIEKWAYDQLVKAHNEKTDLLKAFQKLFGDAEHEIVRLRAALELECGGRCHPEHNPCAARETLNQVSRQGG